VRYLSLLNSRILVLLALLGAMPALPAERIGDIEFFGYKGIDLEKVRAALTVHEADEYSDRAKTQVRQAVVAAIGKSPPM
jgi:hypothetical protein